MEMDMPIPKGRGFTPFPFGQCQVCGAEATGNHYGANTCEGCKGFFKRSLPVFRTFRCFFGNKCEVTPETRNRCKACRFRKCVEAGMALDAVKMGRIPKAVKEHAMEGTSKSGAHRAGRQTSTTSHATSQNLYGTECSSPGGASADNASSPGSTDYGRDDSSPVPGNNSSPMQSEYRPSEARRYGSMVLPSSAVMQGGNKSMPHSASSENNRFYPYARQDRFKSDRNGPLGYPADMLHDGGSSGLLYSLSAGRDELKKKQASHHSLDNGRCSPPDRDGWPHTAPRQQQLPMLDYAARRLSGNDQPGLNLTGDSHGHRPAMLLNFSSLSGGSLSHSSFTRGCSEKIERSLHPQVKPPSAHVRALADMAITGDFNENEPDLVAMSADKLKAVMANSVTAVAVMNPSLRGGSGLPVVPNDVMVFQPSYVPQEKRPDSPFRDSSAHSKLTLKSRRSVDFSSVKLPNVPTLEFFNQTAANPGLKHAMCVNTIRMVAFRNSEIYGEETRANDLFLKETMTQGFVSVESDRTPQQMRDILKERLITQVKRVVQLSESLPGFRTLSTMDQHALLRTCILDVWMVHSARFMRNRQSFILFLESRTHYARSWMEMFLTDEFLDTVFQIAEKINKLDFSFDELSLLKSILIVRPDRPGLQNVDFVTVLHNHLLDSLKLTISTRRPVESGQLLDDLLELLKGWCILDVMQEKYVHPIDLSHFSQGPWKISETSGASTFSVSSKSSSIPASPNPVLQEPNSV